MIRRRRFTPALRRRLTELDEKPGLAPEIIEKRAIAARHRMPIIDAQPEVWRALLNAYPHGDVAALAEVYGNPDRVREILEERGRT